jgi:glycosyltransferase involved in cell wall biosynthesis
MKISVIIPAHNEEKYLSKTLEAILAQDYPDFEVIVVDNASTDKTLDIAKTFSRVKVLFEGNKGTMWACERGRKEAAGEIIVRMDADCLPGKDWLSKGAALFCDKRVVGASGPYYYYDASKFLRWFTLVGQQTIYYPSNVLMQALKIGGISVGGNTFMRASAMQSIGGFDTDLVFYGDDTDIPKRLTAVGEFVYSPHLVMPTSNRRFEAYGYFKLMGTYIFHFFKIVLFGKGGVVSDRER